MPSKSPNSALGPDDIFQCQQCGECCRGYGGTVVNRSEWQAIADYISMAPDRFEKEYCKPSGRKLVLAQGKDGFCRFFRDKLCGIHPVKPRMCRRWPFIEAVILDPGNWRAMAAQCPGMVTDLPDDVIRQVVAKVIKAQAD